MSYAGKRAGTSSHTCLRLGMFEPLGVRVLGSAETASCMFPRLEVQEPLVEKTISRESLLLKKRKVIQPLTISGNG